MRHCFALIALTLLAAGCGPRLHKAELDQVRTVAIVGFTVDIAMEDGDGGDQDRTPGSVREKVDTIRGIVAVAKGDRDPEAERNELGRQYYSALAVRLQDALGWSVVEQGRLAEAGTLQPLADPREVDSVTLSFPVYAGGVPSYARAGGLSASERARLCDELGVDAVAFAKVKVEVGAHRSNPAFTKYYPRGRIRFEVYRGDRAEPIWLDRDASGSTSDDPVRHVNAFSLTPPEQEVVKAAIEDSYEALMRRYSAGASG